MPSTEPQELFPTGRQPEPIVIKVDDMFGIVKESLTTLLNTEGESINQSAVKWPAPPIATGERYFILFKDKDIILFLCYQGWFANIFINILLEGNKFAPFSINT